MKFLAQSLMGSGLGLILLTATPSFATVTGTLFSGGTGTVTVTDSSITFNEDNTTPPGSSTAVGVGTTVTFDGGSLAPGQPIDINGGAAITPTTLAAGVPVTFPDTSTLSMTITSFGPGSSNDNCAGLMIGQSCSPIPGSPIILTYTSGPNPEGTTGGSTDAVLPVSGTASDGTGTPSTFTGSFSATIPDQNPDQLQTLFATNTGASFTQSTYSGSIVASAVPEPREASVIVAASLFIGLAFFKRRKQLQG